MKVLKCPICEANIEISDKTKVGERLTCSNCYAQLALYKHRSKLGRHERKRQLIDEGRL